VDGAVAAPAEMAAPVEGSAGAGHFAPTAPSSAQRMGNLAQVRPGQRAQERARDMLAIGVISVLANAFSTRRSRATSQEEIDKELKKLGPGFVVDPVKLAELKGQAVRATRLINGGGVLLGLLFIGLRDAGGEAPGADDRHRTGPLPRRQRDLRVHQTPPSLAGGSS